MNVRNFVRSLVFFCAVSAAWAEDLRPPATPLVTHDPYFSVWSMADQVNAEQTKHWTGTVQSLCSLARIDGKVYRVIGSDPRGTPALEQKRLQVLPTHTIYEFEGAGIALTLTFLTPALPDNLDVLARPVTYITWSAHSTDRGGHRVRSGGHCEAIKAGATGEGRESPRPHD